MGSPVSQEEVDRSVEGIVLGGVASHPIAERPTCLVDLRCRQFGVGRCHGAKLARHLFSPARLPSRALRTCFGD